MAIRNRRNINCLSAEQLHDLREAFQALYDLPSSSPDSFATLGGIHGLPAPEWCDHWYPGFFTWHRAYMQAFERALQTVHCDVMLPFWDWSSGPSTGVPAACRDATYVNRVGDTVPNPLYSGPIAAAAGGGTTHRRPDIDTTAFDDIAATAQTAMGSSTFSSFQTAMNGPHGSVHIRVGGRMADASYAGFDPIFFLHHCNVDRLWWNWQQTHPGVALPANEAAHHLDPFNRPFTQDWMVGADVVSTDDLGYRYSNWCFVLPPIKIWELIPIWFEPILVRRLRSARLVVDLARMPMESVELRVFVGDEAWVKDARSPDTSSFAGTIGLFGMGHELMKASTRPRPAGPLRLELDVTDRLRSHCGVPDTSTTEREHGGREHDDREHGGREHDGHDSGGDDREGSGPTDDATLVNIRIAAFDVDGRALDAEQVPVEHIDLVVD